MLNCRTHKPGPFPALDISNPQIPKAHTKKISSRLEDHEINVISVGSQLHVYYQALSLLKRNENTT